MRKMLHVMLLVAVLAMPLTAAATDQVNFTILNNTLQPIAIGDMQLLCQSTAGEDPDWFPCSPTSNCGGSYTIPPLTQQQLSDCTAPLTATLGEFEDAQWTWTVNGTNQAICVEGSSDWAVSMVSST